MRSISIPHSHSHNFVSRHHDYQVVSEELFTTFRARPGLMLSADTLADNEEALRRMVAEFAKSAANTEVSSLEEARKPVSSRFAKRCRCCCGGGIEAPAEV